MNGHAQHLCAFEKGITMSKEIGGYMDLEHFTGEEYYPDLVKLNLGRTALVWLLQRMDHRRVFIPSYICSSVTDSARAAGFDVVSYPVDEDLRPVWDECGRPGDDDILYLVNYYGQLTASEIEGYRDSYSAVIVDNAQAFYDRPVEGVHTIYTARKFFGLTDGAYVATDIAGDDSIPQDKSAWRAPYMLGRLEDGARQHYSGMLEVNHTFDREIPRRMSALTENLLRAIDYEAVRQKRCDNYRMLSGLLPDSNPFTRRVPECPFAYPYHCENGPQVRKALAERDIFVQTNWSYLLTDAPEDSLDRRWSADILPLPVDQRYGELEMRVIADAVRELTGR